MSQSLSYSSKSTSSSAVQHGSVELIDPDWEQDQTMIRRFYLLTRGLGSGFFGFGAYHTALLFEHHAPNLDCRFLLVEYGSTGLQIQHFTEAAKKEDILSCMGKADTVDIHDLSPYFTLRDLRFREVYQQFQHFKEIFTEYNYNLVNHNCRDFALELVTKLGCDDDGKAYVKSFSRNFPTLLRFLIFGGLLALAYWFARLFKYFRGETSRIRGTFCLKSHKLSTRIIEEEVKLGFGILRQEFELRNCQRADANQEQLSKSETSQLRKRKYASSESDSRPRAIHRAQTQTTIKDDVLPS